MLRNDQSLGRHWARFVLKNKGSNRSAIGAKLQLHAGGAVQERMIGPTHGYMSQSELAATFGLGSAGKIEKLVIRWPDGKVQEIAGPGVDKLHVIERD